MLNLSDALSLVAKAEMEEGGWSSEQEAIQNLRDSVSPGEVADWREPISRESMSDELWLSYVYVAGVTESQIKEVWDDYKDSD